MSCRALDALLTSALRGRTERDIAHDLENLLHAEGAEGLAFSTIVAAGPNSGIPHHRPSDRPVAAGDLLTIDFGALYRGYHADCTRTLVVGSAADGMATGDLHRGVGRRNGPVDMRSRRR